MTRCDGGRRSVNIGEGILLSVLGTPGVGGPGGLAVYEGEGGNAGLDAVEGTLRAAE